MRQGGQTNNKSTFFRTERAYRRKAISHKALLARIAFISFLKALADWICVEQTDVLMRADVAHVV
jgi:hypothetical protein